MRIPMQSKPVRSQLSSNANGVNASDAACTACKIACSLVPWPASIACNAACNATVC